MSKSNFILSFLLQVEKQPLAIAIEYKGQSISYKKLYDEASTVCDYLGRNASQETYIGLTTESSFRSYANIIGIWMFGAAYVPINANYPKEVRNQMLNELGIKTVLSQSDLKELKSSKSNTLEYDGAGGETAYVIHTSGSTGKSKAALISHGNLNVFTAHYLNQERYDFNANDRFLQGYDLSFDVSVFCFTIPLMIGATLILPESKGVKYMTILSSIMTDRITVCSNVPSVAKYALPNLSKISMDSLRYCFFSGESLYGNWAKAWMNAAKKAQVYNCYGPTETTIVCTTEHLNKLDSSYFESDEPLPLGLPFESMQLKIKDGEICLKGGQVFAGYAHRPETESNGNYFFHTGDMGTMDKDGKLIFKGRKDEQIQINGYRVELSGIDVFIQNEFKVSSKSVVIKDQKKADKIVTVIETQEIDNLKLTVYLKGRLPQYSLPSSFLTIKEFPLNANGKLDVSELKNWVRGKTKDK